MIGRADTVRKRRTALGAVAAAAAVAVVATTLSLVGRGDDTARDPEVVSPGGEVGTFAQALAVLPEGAGLVSFNDRAAAAERLGFTASTPEEYAAPLFAYVDPDAGVADQGGIFTPMSIYLDQMADLPVNDLHVVWSVDGDTGPPAAIGSAGFTVYKVTPETDLDAVADDLVAAGLGEEDLRGRRHLVADNPGAVTEKGIIGDGYPRDFLDVTIDTDADLLILGNLGSVSEEILEVLDGDRESAAGAGTYDALVGDLTDVEVAYMSLGGRCILKPGDRPAGIQKPAQAGYFVHGDDAALTARLVFDDDAIAAADLEARTAYFETGAFGPDEAPVSSYGTYDLIRDGSVIDIAFGDLTSARLRGLLGAPGNLLGC